MNSLVIAGLIALVVVYESSRARGGASSVAAQSAAVRGRTAATQAGAQQSVLGNLERALFGATSTKPSTQSGSAGRPSLSGGGGGGGGGLATSGGGGAGASPSNQTVDLSQNLNAGSVISSPGTGLGPQTFTPNGDGTYTLADGTVIDSNGNPLPITPDLTIGQSAPGDGLVGSPLFSGGAPPPPLFDGGPSPDGVTLAQDSALTTDMGITPWFDPGSVDALSIDDGTGFF